MNYERKEHHPSRRVDRAAHEAREASMLDSQYGVDEMSLDDMTNSGLVHSNIYGERNEGYPGQGAYDYDEFEEPGEIHGMYTHPDERGDAEAAKRGLM